MAQATPTSPWQPTSAPEMEALCFARFPINPAVASAYTTLLLEHASLPCRYFKTAGTIPHDPQVGAVTTIPPEAFSSETASAYAESKPGRCSSGPARVA